MNWTGPAPESNLDLDLDLDLDGTGTVELDRSGREDLAHRPLAPTRSIVGRIPPRGTAPCKNLGIPPKTRLALFHRESGKRKRPPVFEKPFCQRPRRAQFSVCRDASRTTRPGSVVTKGKVGVKTASASLAGETDGLERTRRIYSTASRKKVTHVI
jgi:hypothetical protein